MVFTFPPLNHSGSVVQLAGKYLQGECQAIDATPAANGVPTKMMPYEADRLFCAIINEDTTISARIGGKSSCGFLLPPRTMYVFDGCRGELYAKGVGGTPNLSCMGEYVRKVA